MFKLKRLFLQLLFLLAFVSGAEASYYPTTIKSTQRGTISVTSSGSASGTTSATATITSVNTTTTVVRVLGWRLNNTDTSVAVSASVARVVLTNATTITATIFNGNTAGTVVISYEVLEFIPAFIKSLQTGTVSIAASATTGDTTVTSVNTAKAQLFFNGQNFSDDDGSVNINSALGTVDLSTATNVHAVRSGAHSALVVGFTLIEFK